tara:strand:+ start:251 stop:502 length:252 start_codon:yes stop_codon:yes gene_type:complete
MTKVSVFGKQPTEKKELKKIEFKMSLLRTGDLGDNIRKPTFYSHVELFKKDDGFGYDIIIAWVDDGENMNRDVILGHWNDGVV